jgi:hypothetical protein
VGFVDTRSGPGKTDFHPAYKVLWLIPFLESATSLSYLIVVWLAVSCVDYRFELSWRLAAELNEFRST